MQMNVWMFVSVWKWQSGIRVLPTLPYYPVNRQCLWMKTLIIKNATHNKFMTKDLRKAIMDRSRLGNKFNQNRTSENWHECKRQTKKDYFAKTDIKSRTGNKTFTDKSSHENHIILNEDGKSIKGTLKKATIFNKYFF